MAEENVIEKPTVDDKSANDKCANDKCGSCGWSIYPYKTQLEYKLRDINDSLKKSGLPVSCEKITSSPVTSYYRNRMDFVVNYEGNFGLREKGKWWKVLDGHTCFLPDKNIISAFHAVYPWVKDFKNTDFGAKPYFDRKTYEGILRYIIIRSTTTKEVMINVLTSVPQDTRQEKLIKSQIQNISKLTDVTSLIWSTTQTKSDISLGENISVIYGAPYIKEEINNISYNITPNSFFQTNPYGAKILMDLVTQHIQEAYAGNKEGSADYKSTLNVVDLYCGTGFFTIPVSKITKNITGVENNKFAVEDAVANAKANNSTAKFVLTESEKFTLTDLKPDILIVDPPRSGLGNKVIKNIIECPPKKIIYISCSHKTLAQDLALLKNHYNINDLQAVDMFPNTPHVETISTLRFNILRKGFFQK